MVPLFIMENPMGRPRFVIGLKSNRSIGDVGPRIPDSEVGFAVKFSGKTEMIHLFELTHGTNFRNLRFKAMFEKCFRSWDESIRGLSTLWRRDWSFPPRPGRDRSKRSSIHHPPGLLARYSLFGGFLLLVSSVSVAQDPATVGQFSSVTTWPYTAA